MLNYANHDAAWYSQDILLLFEGRLRPILAWLSAPEMRVHLTNTEAWRVAPRFLHMSLVHYRSHAHRSRGTAIIVKSLP